jgi:dTDP-4-amino-4,6-dideoxygalactose transaminase
MVKYNPYPLGEIPKELQRKELDQLRDAGYEFNDAREVVTLFENKVAVFAGSKYAVAIDCCSNGLFLALKYYEEVFPNLARSANHTIRGCINLNP